ncbi:hypothetical protein [Vibrio sp. M260112]|uniref:hypothetical protein n=1 Tax=Vibrio sp. M260112 TaxID=3020895 RepID=UPI002F3E6560
MLPALESEHDDSGNTLITIPVRKNDLGNFISDLLGQKQSLERNYGVDFKFDHSWLMNLHEMIDQRICQQSESHLINFTAVIYFEDGMKRSITSIEAFRAYAETKTQLTTDIKIVWEYLVHFPRKNHPEKQQISFTASIANRKPPSSSSQIDKLARTLAYRGEKSLINVQIDHTERTWGDDIENIISSCVDEATRPITWPVALLEICRLIMDLGIIVFAYAYPIYTGMSTTTDYLQDLQDQYKQINELGLLTTEALHGKTDLVFESIGRIEDSKNTGFVLLLGGMFLGPIISMLFLFCTRSTRQSFIIITTKDEKLAEKADAGNRTKGVIIVVSYLASILAGVIGNYGFKFLTGG